MEQNQRKKPPKWSAKLLRWFYDPGFLEDVEGDLYERYAKRIKGREAANWLFISDVLSLFRRQLVRKIASSYRLNYHICHYQY